MVTSRVRKVVTSRVGKAVISRVRKVMLCGDKKSEKDDIGW